MLSALTWSHNSWLRWLWKHRAMASLLALKGNICSGSCGQNPGWKILSKRNEKPAEGREGKSWPSPLVGSWCLRLAVVTITIVNSWYQYCQGVCDVHIDAIKHLCDQCEAVLFQNSLFFGSPYPKNCLMLKEKWDWTLSPQIHGSVELSLQGNSGVHIFRKEMWEKRWNRWSCWGWVCGDRL